MPARAIAAPSSRRRWRRTSSASRRCGTTAAPVSAAAALGCSANIRSPTRCMPRWCCASTPTARAFPRPPAGTWRAYSRMGRCRSGCRPRSRSRRRSPPMKSAEGGSSPMALNVRPHPWLLVCTLTALGSLACILPAASALAAQGAAPFTPEDLNALRRVTDPQVSPDGRFVVFVQRETDLDANKGRTSLWLLPLVTPGAQPQRLIDAASSASSPRWASDSRTLYFLSTASGSSQVWRLMLGDRAAQRVTDYPLEVGSLKVSARGERLALTMQVFPDCPTLDCTRARLEARGKDKANARTYERIFVRHWDSWSNGTRSHLFTARLTPRGTTEPPVDVSRGFDADIPGKPFGGDEDFTFSPDGRTLVFSARIAGRDEPWSTNFDLFLTAVDGSAAPVNLTAGNPAWD